MIRGTVNDRHEAIVRLRLRGPKGAETDEGLVIDTGYSAAITLPRNIVGYLDLDFHVRSEWTLADGVVRMLEIFKLEVEWNGACGDRCWRHARRTLP